MRDLIVLGGGPAGYTAAERAANAGLDVLLAEEREVGGVCLNEGCIPTKSLLYSAKTYEHALHGAAYGVYAPDIRLVHAEALARKDKVVKKLVAGVRSALKAAGVETVRGRGRILGRTPDGFIRVELNEREHTTKRLLIATGSEPALPPVTGLRESLESGFALTNREALELPDVPERLVVVGGGAVGLEMAVYYNTAGSAVTVVEMLTEIGGPIDEDIARILRKNLEKKGIHFELGAKVVSVGGGVVCERGGERFTLGADKVLFAAGRKPRAAGIGLENAGLRDVSRGVKTDRFMRAGAPGIYAAGDVTGGIMLAHVAYRQAEVAVGHMTGGKDEARYDAVPSVIYTSPEVGLVGETERSAAEKGYDVRRVTLPMNYSGRYAAENEDGDGIIKLVADARSRRVLGCHAIGSYASEMIVIAGVLIETRVTVERARQMIFPHPTVGEIIREALICVR